MQLLLKKKIPSICSGPYISAAIAGIWDEPWIPRLWQANGSTTRVSGTVWHSSCSCGVKCSRKFELPFRIVCKSILLGRKSESMEQVHHSGRFMPCSLDTPLFIRARKLSVKISWPPGKLAPSDSHHLSGSAGRLRQNKGRPTWITLRMWCLNKTHFSWMSLSPGSSELQDFHWERFYRKKLWR